jgi:hypothetical protein
MKFKEFALNKLKNPLTYIVLFIISVLLHNLWYAVFGFEDAIFFTLAVVVFPICFVVFSLNYLIKKSNSSKK